MQDLQNSLEAALKYRVEEGNFGANIYTGQGDYVKEHPSLTIAASGGPEFPLGSGNFTVTVDCEFRYPAESDQLDEHRQLCRDVLGQLMDSNLAALLSSEATDLHVFGITSRNIGRAEVEENQWISVLTMEIYCCRTDLS